MTSQLTLTRHDNSKEHTRTSPHVADLTAANFDAQMALVAELRTRIDAVCNSPANNIVYGHEYYLTAKTFAGHRELKWLVKAQDDTTFLPVKLELGTAKTSVPTVVANGTELMDPASSEYTNLVSAIEDLCLSNQGNSISVIEIELVGRNL